jgi:lipopolysaccharide/colanic/teichoic acid biosynthesis glycosyltransferase
MRRLFDLAAASIGLILLSPLLLVIAVSIRVTSPGPAIFRQKRVGIHGREFTIFKFRTMRTDAKGSDRSISSDHRITPMGTFLRRHKLDEMPQLLNIIRGDMCLVGPRPKLRGHHSADIRLRPGLTGAASVAFASEEVLLRHIPEHHLEDCHRLLITPHKVRMDSQYMTTATFWTDLRLLLMTIRRSGRYLSLDELGDWHPDSSVTDSIQPAHVGTAEHYPPVTETTHALQGRNAPQVRREALL